MIIEYRQKPFTGRRRVKISADDILNHTGVKVQKISRGDDTIRIWADTDFDLEIEGFSKHYGAEEVNAVWQGEPVRVECWRCRAITEYSGDTPVRETYCARCGIHLSPMFHKVVQWGDGKTELFVLGDDFSVNINPVGMCLSSYSPKTYQWWNDLEWHGNILGKLSGMGVRIVRWGAEYTTTEHIETMLKLLRDRKFFVEVDIRPRFLKGFTGKQYDFELEDGTTFSEFVRRCCGLINQYDNVICVGCGNELNRRMKAGGHRNVTVDQDYTVEEITQFMTEFVGDVKALTDLPITHNLTGAVNDTGIDEAILNMVDIPCYDLYSTPDEIENWIDNRGITGNFWTGEINYGGKPNGWVNDSSKFDRSMIDRAHSKGSQLAFLWWSKSPHQNDSFFDDDGVPIKSLCGALK